MSDIKQKVLNLKSSFGKFKYTVIILLVGVALMCIPFDGNVESKEDLQEPPIKESDLQASLQEILSKVDGVGEVAVLLSPETGITHVYQENTQSRTSDGTQEEHCETVLMSDGGTERPLETVISYPIYRGALVVCQGADKASVKLAVIQAVSEVTGLGSDQITVIKMKGKQEA